MARMRIFTRSSLHLKIRRRQIGATLIELLATLAVLSLSTLITASAVNARRPGSALNHAADLLVSDLKRMRLEAQKSGVDKILFIDANGYQLDGEFLRELAHGVSLEIADGKDSIVYTRGYAPLGASVTLRKANLHATIVISPITGKIERVE